VLRRLIYWILVIAFLYVVSVRYDEIIILTRTIAAGEWLWVIAAALLQVIYLTLFTTSFKFALYTVEIKRGFFDLLPVMLGSLFVNVVAPAGGVAGIALFVDDSSRRGFSPMRSTAGMILQLIADFSTLTLVLIAGVIYLFIQGGVRGLILVGLGIIFLVTVGLGVVLLLGLWRPSLLIRLFRFIQNVINHLVLKFGKRKLLTEEWAQKSAEDYIGAAEAISHHPRRLMATGLIMLAAHVVAIISLYLLFLAFYGPIEIGVIVAAYAVGILSLIIAPLPQGTGVIEGAMVLAFISLGVAWDVAFSVTLTYRGVTFWLPLVIGFLLLRKVKTFEVMGRPGSGWGVKIPALLIGFMGLVVVLSIPFPQLREILPGLAKLLPLWISSPWPGVDLILGIALLVLAYGLGRQKRSIWIVSLLVLGSALVFHLVSANYAKVPLAAGLTLWLILGHSLFYVASDRLSVQRAVRIITALTLFLALVGFVTSGWVFDQLNGLQEIVLGIDGETSNFALLRRPNKQLLRGYEGSFLVLGALGYLSAIVLFNQPVKIRKNPSQQERQRAKRIVEQFGRSSMAFFATLDDKHYYFSLGGSVIAFTVWGRVAVTLGDPIGPRGDVKATVAAFQDLCWSNDWIPAFCLTMPDYIQEYRQAGFETLCLGHEGVIPLKDFSLSGGASSNYRKRYNRMLEQGYRVEFHDPPIADELLLQLRQVSDEWKTKISGSEKRFFLGWFHEKYVRRTKVAAVQTPNGRITAFVTIVPEYQRNEISIDLIRRKLDAKSGTMDFLFVKLFFWARDRGFDTFNMGLSALSGVGERPGSSALERLIHFIYEHGNWFYDFKGINAFKKKFNPHWDPQYLVFPTKTNLPYVWLAMMIVNSGGKNIPWEIFKQKQEIPADG